MGAKCDWWTRGSIPPGVKQIVQSGRLVGRWRSAADVVTSRGAPDQTRLQLREPRYLIFAQTTSCRVCRGVAEMIYAWKGERVGRHGAARFQTEQMERYAAVVHWLCFLLLLWNLDLKNPGTNIRSASVKNSILSNCYCGNCPGTNNWVSHIHMVEPKEDGTSNGKITNYWRCNSNGSISITLSK